MYAHGRSKVGRACILRQLCLARARRICTASSPFLDWSSAAEGTGVVNHVTVYPGVITTHEEKVFLDALDPVFKMKRYMSNHWDHVIEDYKESERFDESWPAEAKLIIDKVRALPPLQAVRSGSWLPVHAIDLSAKGHIMPHVDSAKFGGGFVAGLSLLSSRIMVLKPDKEGGGSGYAENAVISMLLEPRSLYIIEKDARYLFTHEVPATPLYAWKGKQKLVECSRRISLIFRDEP